MAERPVCIECKYFKANAFSEVKYHDCTHPDLRHPVSGRPQPCVDMRKNTYGTSCRINGYLWEAKK